MLVNLICAMVLSGAAPALEGPFQDLTFDQALAAAKKDGKIVMIDFFTTWCQPCKRLDKVTWADETVQRWLGEKTVPLKIDAEKEGKLAERFDVHAYPTIVFVKADGTKIDAIVGFKKPDEFLSLAKGALAGRTSAVLTQENLERLKAGLVGRENDPQARQEYADKLAEAKHYQEALTEYLWCFDTGMKSPYWAGVRVSFLLSDITKLGESYPPAIKALEERRDAAEAKIASTSESEQDTVDAIAINRELNQTERNLALYDRMRAVKPLPSRVRAVLSREILPLLVDRRRYVEAIALFDKPEGYVTGLIQMFRSTPRFDPPDDAARNAMDQARRSMQRTVVSECAGVYEAALGASKQEIAGRIADELVAFAPTGGTYSILIESAVRADAPSVARTLVERGLASLPEAERAEVSQAAKSIPEPK
jgi:thioredoxin-related protein